MATTEQKSHGEKEMLKKVMNCKCKWSRLSSVKVGSGLTLLFLFLWVAAGLAQSPTGNFTGTVTDPSGSVIPGAKVSLLDEATGFVRISETNAEGIYRFPFVNPSVYTIRAEAGGFSQYVNEHVTLNARQTLQINIALKLGASEAEVTVTAQAPLVNTDNGMIGESQSSRILNEGPRGTPILGAISNDVGKTSVLVRDGSIGAVDFKAAGSRAGGWDTAVDGNSAVLNGSSNLSLPYQAMREQQITVVGAPAEYRTPLTINAVTKGGTNDVHGSYTYSVGWPFLNALPANAPGAKRGPNVPSHVWNLTAGGPVYLPKVYNGRDRSFWFFSFERTPPVNSVNPQGQVLDVPTAAMRSGNFQPFFNAAGTSTKQLVNPFTGQPFTNNVIPSSLFNPAAVNTLANLLPAPNSTLVNPDLPRQNYIGRRAGSNAYSVFFLRADQKITSRNTASFTYNQSPFTSTFTNSLPGLGDNVLIGRPKQYAWSDTHTFSSRVVNEARVSFFLNNNQRYSNAGSTVGEVASLLGINLGADAAFRNPYRQTPVLRITGFTYLEGATVGGVYAQDERKQPWTQIRDNLSIQAGRHAFKMGYDQLIKRDDRPPANIAIGGVQSFNGAFTGDPFADFLLGLPQTVNRYTSEFPLLKLRSNELGFYFQDDFRVNGRLNLSLGLRYDRKWFGREIHGANVNFNPRNGALIFEDQAAIDKVPAAFPTTILKETAAQAGYPERLINPVNSWMPRIGFAYKLSPNHDVVLRGAYSVFSVDAGNINNAFRIQNSGPFALSETFTNRITSGTPLMTLDKPFPNLVGQGPSTVGTGGAVPNLGIPFMQQYTLSLESRLFAGWVGTLSYVGSRTTQLYYTRQINRPPASLTPFTTSRFVYPGYSAVNFVDKGATADYNSLQARVQHRYSNGLELDAMFQWMSEITDVADTGFSQTGDAPEDPYCRRCGQVKNPYTDKLNFRAISLYELPLGQGKRFASGANRYANAVIGGWTVSSLVDMAGGRPGAVFYSGQDPSNTNLRSGFAKIIPGCNVRSGDGRSSPYININCFAVPDAGTFGNARWGAFRNPGFWTVGASVYKYFPLYRDRAKLRINAVFTNAFNHPIFTSVGSSLASPASFGRFGGQGATSSFAGARTIRFQGQIMW